MKPIALYGIEPVYHCLLAESREFHGLWIKQGLKSPRISLIEKLAREKGVPSQRVDQHRLGSVAGMRHHQGVVLECGEKKVEDLDDYLGLPEENKKILIASDQIEDPQNLGAIIRSARFFGVDGLLQTSRKSAPLSPAVSKASAGMLEGFSVYETVNLSRGLDRLKKDGFFVIGADSHQGEDFQNSEGFDRLVLVLGNEGQGLRQLIRKNCDRLVTIEAKGEAESLNVSNAAAILIHHFTKG